MKNSYWGKVQTSKTLVRGVTWVSTAGHGGFMISKGWAEKNLTETARKYGAVYGGYLCYEEDIRCEIIFLEHPEFHTNEIFTNEYNREKTIKNLSGYYPQYLIEVGIEPSEVEYQAFLSYERRNQRAKEKCPNLVVSALKENENVTKVWTADERIHYVTAESYQTIFSNRKGWETNLSDLVQI